MKHKKILISGIITIIAAAGVVALTQTSLAANTASSTAKHLNWRGNKDVSGETDKMRGPKGPNPEMSADRLKKQQAVEAALQANDYNAWVTAVGTSSPLLTKINTSNFAQFVQAYQLKQQADAIMTSLGINQGPGFGLMAGHSH